MKKIQQRKQKGFTLVELGIVLALIGIGLFFAISKINETSDVSRAQNVSSDISTIITGVKRYYATQPEFPNTITQSDLINFGVFPPSWVRAASTSGGTTTAASVVPPFGGSLTLVRNSTDANSADMTIPNVPARVCTELGRLMSNGATVIEVGSTTVKQLNGQLNLNLLGTNCTGGTNMVFRFTRA
jgi:prepilin-type N-terminal cleavage/methylation domain-containing protein